MEDSVTESRRIKLADTNTQVIELVPRGAHDGWAPDSGHTMPLAQFLDVVFSLLKQDPDCDIMVERVQPLSHAEARPATGRSWRP